MKKEYKKPLTEIVYLNANKSFQDELIQDSTGVISGSDPEILGNEDTFEEEDFIPSKSVWD